MIVDINFRVNRVFEQLHTVKTVNALMLAGPDAIKSLQASVKNLQQDLTAVKGSKAGERFARLQADLKVHMAAGQQVNQVAVMWLKGQLGVKLKDGQHSWR